MVANFVQVLASGALLFLATTTTTTLAQPADDSSFTTSTTTFVQPPYGSSFTTTTTFLQPTYSSSFTTSTDDRTVQCEAELAGCTDDDACISCVLLVNANSNGEFGACTGGVIGDNDVVDDSSFTFSCGSYLDKVCCLDEVSDLDCLQNDNFVDYSLCFLEAIYCSVDEITCDGDGSSTNASSGTVAASVAGHASIAAVLVAFFVEFLPLQRV